MIVAFLYVVALCPNPVFSRREGRFRYVGLGVLVFLVLVGPVVVMGLCGSIRFPVEVASLGELFQ